MPLHESYIVIRYAVEADSESEAFDKSCAVPWGDLNDQIVSQTISLAVEPKVFP